MLNKDIRTSTKALYKSKMKAFAKYCAISGANPKTCHPNVIVNFIAKLVRKKRLSYQTVCGYPSAISKQHAGVPLEQLPEIKRLARANFIEKPPIPRYLEIWDVDRVLSLRPRGRSEYDRPYGHRVVMEDCLDDLHTDLIQVRPSEMMRCKKTMISIL